MPKDVKVDLSGIKLLDIAKAQKERLGTLLDLTDAQVKRIKKRLRKEIEQWLEETSELHRILEEDNDLVEGIFDESQALWDGAFVTHIPVTGMYMSIFRSVERRSILGADVIWYGELMPGTSDKMRPVLAMIEEMMNYKSRKEWNISDRISDAIWNANRDRIGILQIVYAEEYRTKSDVAIVTSVDEFMEVFPNPEDAGLSEEDYASAVEQVKNSATDENPIEIPYTADEIKYQGPKGYIVDLVNFPVFPPTVSDIEDENCRGYGKRFPLRKGILKKRSKDGIWYPDAVKTLIKKGEGATETPAFQLAQEEIEGFSRSESGSDYWFFELFYKMDLGENGKPRGDKEREFLFTYNYDHDELVAAMEYPYRVEHYATFRTESRPNRLLGISVPQMTRELNEEINFQHIQRNNSRTITEVPSFKMRKGSNQDFDPEAEENRWRPGVIFQLDEPDAFQQFTVQPVDLGTSMQEEANNMKLLDLRTGAAASILSGGVAPGDPSAPGNKTAALIGQTNMRMDDPIFELRKGVEKTGDICLSHELQFGPTFIQFESELADGTKVMRTLHKKFLRGVRMRMSAVTAARNPDAEFAQAIQMYGVASKDPLVAQDDEIRWEMLRTAYRRGRIENRDKMLPPLAVVRQRMIDRQKAAMQQLAAEKQAQEAKMKQEQIKSTIQEAQRSLKLRSAAKDIAEKGLGLRKPSASAVAGVNGK